MKIEMMKMEMMASCGCEEGVATWKELSDKITRPCCGSTPQGFFSGPRSSHCGRLSKALVIHAAKKRLSRVGGLG
jgi:hypothetical protein